MLKSKAVFRNKQPKTPMAVCMSNGHKNQLKELVTGKAGPT